MFQRHPGGFPSFSSHHWGREGGRCKACPVIYLDVPLEVRINA